MKVQAEAHASTKARVAEMVRLYRDQGVSTEKIAVLFDYNRSYVRAQLLRAGMTRPLRHDAIGSVDEKILKKEGGTPSCPGKHYIKFAKDHDISVASARYLYRHVLGFRIGKCSNIDGQLVVSLYVDEWMAKDQIARKIGCSTPVVCRILKDHGVTLRSRHEQGEAAWRKFSAEKRASMVKSAHAAVTGAKRTRSALLKSASSRAGKCISSTERKIYNLLVSNGLYPVPGYQLDVFNVDLAFVEEKLAIEVDGGNWHSTQKKYVQDTRKSNALAVIGWRTFRVSVSSQSKFKADDIVANIKACLAA